MSKLGDLRPSQMIYTFGVGSLMDLPKMSVLILGLDDWDTKQCLEISEPRLLRAVQNRVGPQLTQLFLPPVGFDERPVDPALPVPGVPVAPFPRWLRCPKCDRLAPIDSGFFQLIEDKRRPDRTRYVHAACRGGNPDALPVRFLLACRNGHLTDFPWADYVHRGKTPCTPSVLTLREYGAAGDASDIIVQCKACNVSRRMGDAFDREEFQVKCSGHHPHLRMVESEGCKEEARTILLGASNSWFPMVMSALSIPKAVDPLSARIEEHWELLKDIPSLDVAKYVTAPSRMPSLAEFGAEDIWQAIETKRAANGQESTQEEDLKVPEWEALSMRKVLPAAKDFLVRKVDPPLGYESFFEPTVLLERVREVRALFGFTRIESTGDFADATPSEDDRGTALSRHPPKWLPVSEVRGEGVFIRLREEQLQAWENQPDVRKMEHLFMDAHRIWRKKRKIEPAAAGFPGMRYILLHSISHALLRQISLECGYTAASLRERLYCKLPGDEHGPMAGILIYTSASDSEGTLGGLVKLGEPLTLGRHWQQALEAVRICGSDPLCSESMPVGEGRGIHGACCHSCLFVSETSCERGNRYLDRSTLVETFARRGIAFFGGEEPLP